MLAAILTLSAPALADGIEWEHKDLEFINEDILEQLEGVELDYDDSRFDWIKRYIAENDATGPEVRVWAVIEGPDGIVDEVVVTESPETLEIQPDETLVLFASANEHNGGALANIALHGETLVSCVDATNTFGQQQRGTWYTDNPDPDLNDDVFYDWRLVALSIPAASLGCPSGYSRTGWRATFAATATNFAGLSSQTATVTTEMP